MYLTNIFILRKILISGLRLNLYLNTKNKQINCTSGVNANTIIRLPHQNLERETCRERKRERKPCGMVFFGAVKVFAEDLISRI